MKIPTEEITVWFGSFTRLVGKDDSPVLAQLPITHYPDPKPACATCPAKDWYLTSTSVRCFCTVHNYISWVSNDEPVLGCDARERRIQEAHDDRDDDPPTDYGG